MLSTDFKEFKKLFDRIPKERLDNVRFIPLQSTKKIPYRGESWKNYKLTYYECKDKMKMMSNIGVVALPKGICIVDIDTNKDRRILDIDIANELDCYNTFTVLTRSNGLHFYFLNDGGYNTQDLIVNGENIGELRANWSYVLSAGSFVDMDGYKGNYTVIQDKPIRPFPKEFFDKYFLKGDTETRKDEKIVGKVGHPISDRIKKHMIEIGLKV
jgi:hypothetical protein